MSESGGAALLAAPSAAFLRTSVVNLGLRGVTMASKLLFLVYIGKYLSVPDMAIYGLMATTVGFGVTLLGVEFYAFSTREFLARDADVHAVLLRDQLAFYGVAYLLLLPLAIPVFVTGVLPWPLAGWFYALTIAEHLAQEVARLFNTQLRPVLSSALFFLRSAAWGVVVMVVGLWYPAANTIVFVLAAWTAGVAVSLVWSAVVLSKLDWQKARNTAVDWQWIRRGLIVAAPFFTSAIAYRVIELSNRYIIHFFLTPEAVAVFSFYSTLANVLPAVIGAGITSIVVPRVVGAYQRNAMVEYRQQYRFMNVATIVVIVLVVPIVFAGVVALQDYLGRPEYARALSTCLLLLISTAVSVIAQLPGVALYARKDDVALLIAVVMGAGSSTILNFLLIPIYGINGAAWATTVAYTVMGAYQWYRVR
jgi:O-antigen/teichoic acid export membrane protein